MTEGVCRVLAHHGTLRVLLRADLAEHGTVDPDGAVEATADDEVVADNAHVPVRTQSGGALDGARRFGGGVCTTAWELGTEMEVCGGGAEAL